MGIGNEILVISTVVALESVLKPPSLPWLIRLPNNLPAPVRQSTVGARAMWGWEASVPLPHWGQGRRRRKDWRDDGRDGMTVPSTDVCHQTYHCSRYKYRQAGLVVWPLQNGCFLQVSQQRWSEGNALQVTLGKVLRAKGAVWKSSWQKVQLRSTLL